MTMTLDQMRDRLAELMGWTPPGVDLPAGPGTSWPQDPPGSVIKGGIGKLGKLVDRRVVERSCDHPIPLTLDGLAAVWPEGWVWIRWYDLPDLARVGDPLVMMWVAHPPGTDRASVRLVDTGNEYADRLALTLAVMEEVAKEKTHGE